MLPEVEAAEVALLAALTTMNEEGVRVVRPYEMDLPTAEAAYWAAIEAGVAAVKIEKALKAVMVARLAQK